MVARRDALLDELDRIREANVRATSRLTATRISGTGRHSSFEDGAIRAVDSEASLQRVIEQIDECLADRLAVIEKLTDERQKLVLTYRYINGWGWEEVERQMHYSEKQIFRIHGLALSNIQGYLQNNCKFTILTSILPNE